MFDDLANRFGIAVAVENKEFDVFCRQRFGQGFGIGYPVAMRGMACVALDVIRTSSRPVTPMNGDRGNGRSAKNTRNMYSPAEMEIITQQ